eukprot:g4762.t1
MNLELALDGDDDWWVDHNEENQQGLEEKDSAEAEADALFAPSFPVGDDTNNKNTLDALFQQGGKNRNNVPPPLPVRSDQPPLSMQNDRPRQMRNFDEVNDHQYNRIPISPVKMSSRKDVEVPTTLAASEVAGDCLEEDPIANAGWLERNARHVQVDKIINEVRNRDSFNANRIDPDVFSELPSDVQRDVIRERTAMVDQPSAPPSPQHDNMYASAPPPPLQDDRGDRMHAAAAPPGVDPEVFGNLPLDIQQELLLSQSRETIRRQQELHREVEARNQLPQPNLPPSPRSLEEAQRRARSPERQAARATAIDRAQRQNLEYIEGRTATNNDRNNGNYGDEQEDRVPQLQYAVEPAAWSAHAPRGREAQEAYLRQTELEHRARRTPKADQQRRVYSSKFPNRAIVRQDSEDGTITVWPGQSIRSSNFSELEARERRQLLMEPRIKSDGVLHCVMLAQGKDGSKGFIFQLASDSSSSGMFLMSAKKGTMLTRGRNIIISSSGLSQCKRDSRTYLGKIRGKGKVHMLYDWGLASRDVKQLMKGDRSAYQLLRREFACLIYSEAPRKSGPDSFPQRVKGKHRLIALLPETQEIEVSSDKIDNISVTWRQNDDADGALQRAYRKGEFFRKQGQVKALKAVCGIAPNLTTYSNIQPNRRNLSLVTNTGDTHLVIGATRDSNVFEVYVKAPISLFQAFGIAISAYLSKY